LTNSGLVGSVEPRLWTKPLRALTTRTSYGFDVIDFARDVLGIRLFPWQEWLLIHMCELQPSGLPRFRRVLICIARQNGKTEILVVLSLYWLFIERARNILGTSTKISTAQESWEKAVAYAEDTPELAKSIAPNGVRRANGQNSLTTVDRCRYKIAASNRQGGRGSTNWKAILDELREHHDYSAYGAVEPTITTIPDGQLVMLSNAGDDRSVVLNEIRDQAIEGHDDSLALFEWSAETDDPLDVANLLAANPSIGHNIDIEVLLKAARAAKAAGGDQLTAFITEHLCRRVALLNPAIDLDAWAECREDGNLDGLRDRISLCLDVSIDELHATLYAAAVDGERVRVDVVQAWEGQNAIREMSAALPSLVAKVAPKVFGWFPNGPSAAAAAALTEREGWPPDGVELAPIRNDVTAVCMGFAEQVRSLVIAHSGDPLLDAHVRASEKLYHGDGWRFTRRGAGHVDAAYAAAGAVHLARTLPSSEVGVFFV
jgi:hypothetical protein